MSAVPARKRHPMEAIEQLRAEHRVIETTLPLIGRLRATFEGAEQMMEFLQVFMDQCHHAKEERVLFPRLEARGVPKREGLIFELLKEHGLIRRYLHEIAGLLHTARTEEDTAAEGLLNERLAELIAAVQDHVNKEELQLWPAAERALLREDNVALLAGFAEIEEGQIGEQRYRKYLNWARLWSL